MKELSNAELDCLRSIAKGYSVSAQRTTSFPTRLNLLGVVITGQQRFDVLHRGR